jgi:hypothetical protein
MQINYARHINDGTTALDSGDEDDPSNNLPPNPRRTETDQVMTKARLTSLSIAVVRRNVAQFDDIAEMSANGTAKSIQEWANIMFADPETGERDYSQQRAFEVIVSMFVLTFHAEAALNEKRNMAKLQERNLRHDYNKLKSRLQKNDGNDEPETIDHVHDGCRWKR